MEININDLRDDDELPKLEQKKSANRIQNKRFPFNFNSIKKMDMQ